MRKLSTILAFLAAACWWAAPAFATTWYIHSGNASGGRDGTAANPYNSFTEWHTAINGAGSSTSGIGLGDVLVCASSESSPFRDGPWVLNFQGSTSKSLTVRAWQSTDPNPSALTIQRPVFRGDVLLSSAFTLDGTTGYYKTEVLPAAVTAVHQLLYKYDDATRWTKEGFRTGHMNVVNAAADPGAGTVPAGAAAYNTSTRVLWINTSGLTTTPADYAYCAAGYSTSGKSNAAICFQNCYNCVFDGLEVMAFYEGTAGWYGLSMENATNCAIRNCKTTDTSHHGVGFTGTSSPGNVNCIIENCEIFGLGGTNAGLAAARSGAGFLMGNSAGNANCVARNVTVHLYGHLGTSSTPIYTNTFSPFWAGSTGGGTMTGCSVENCRFIYYPAYVSTTTLTTPITAWTTSTPSDRTNPASYPMVVRDCEVLNMGGWVIDGYTGTPPSQSVAFQRCVLDFSGFASQTARSSYDGVVNMVVGGTNNNYFLFQQCVISASAPGLASAYPNFFTCGSGAGSTTRYNLTFDRSTVMWNGGKVGSTAYTGMFEFRAGSSGSTGMTVQAYNSIFGFPYCPAREAAAGGYGDRYMNAGDGSLTVGTDIIFRGCGYYNFVAGKFSSNTAQDTWAEWNSVVDTTGVKLTMAPLVGLPYRATLNPALPSSVLAQFNGLPTSPGVQPPSPLHLRGRGR